MKVLDLIQQLKKIQRRKKKGLFEKGRVWRIVELFVFRTEQVFRSILLSHK